MIEYDTDVKDQENYMNVCFIFSKMKEEHYMNRRPIKSCFTFIRPFLINKKSNKKDVHLQLFSYFKHIFERASKPDSPFIKDSKTMQLVELYEKYVLNSN